MDQQEQEKQKQLNKWRKVLEIKFWYLIATKILRSKIYVEFLKVYVEVELGDVLMNLIDYKYINYLLFQLKFKKSNFLLNIIGTF